MLGLGLRFREFFHIGALLLEWPAVDGPEKTWKLVGVSKWRVRTCFQFHSVFFFSNPEKYFADTFHPFCSLVFL